MTKCYDTFLDYIPEPSMGNNNYKKALQYSYERDKSTVHPLYALLKVTDRCNGHCRYCAHADNSNEGQDVSTEFLEDVLDQLAAVGCVSVNFTGGEPFLRDDLAHLIRYARRKGLYPVVLTNGLLLQKYAQIIGELDIGMVMVSVDSVRPEAYRYTRGVSLKPVLKGIDALLSLDEEKKPVITVTSVITSQNVDHLQELVEYFSERGVGIIFTPYHHHGRWEEDILSPEKEKQKRIIRGLLKMKDEGYRILNSRDYLQHSAKFESKKRKLPDDFKCYCGYTTLFIDSKMNLRACWSQGVPIIGNLREKRLQKLIDGDRIKEIRKKIRKLECEHCWLLCTGEISLRWKP